MLSISLPEDCQSSNLVSIDIPHQSTTRSFKKISTRHSKISSRSSSAEGKGNVGYWYGEDSNDGSSFNYIQDENGNIAGSLVDITNNTVMRFQIENGTPTVIITDSADYPPEMDPPNEADHMDDRNLYKVSRKDSSSSSFKNNLRNQIEFSNSSTSGGSRSLYDDLGGNIDVMVVWTKEAECGASGLPSTCTITSDTTNTMQNIVNLAIEETNTAYSLSGVNTELLLVHSYMHPTYVEPNGGFQEALSDLRNDGISGVLANRSTYGADVVALFNNDSAFCGIGYIGPRIDLMFSVTAWRCATGYFSFGHEIGHNMGLLHDRGTSNACNGNNFNYGYRDPGAQFRSILAYNCVSGQCDNNQGGGCTRVQRFSNPTLGFNGSPIGSATEDNARQINNVRVQIAGYFPHVSDSSPTASPTESPTASPTESPTESPTASPTESPTESPVTPTPTASPNTTSPTASPTTSPTAAPTASPTASPITSPSASPTTSPTASPTASPVLPTPSPTKSPVGASTCEDYPNSFIVRINNRNRRRTCAWVSDDTNRCDLNGVEETCPLTCGTCSTCADSPLKLRVVIKGRNKNRRCAWAAKRPVKRCGFVPELKIGCRDACGQC